MNITSDQREALIGVATRAINEGWYGYTGDCQSGIAAVVQEMGEMFPNAPERSIRDAAVEIGMEAMREIESEMDLSP